MVRRLSSGFGAQLRSNHYSFVRPKICARRKNCNSRARWISAMHVNKNSQLTSLGSGKDWTVLSLLDSPLVPAKLPLDRWLDSVFLWKWKKKHLKTAVGAGVLNNVGIPIVALCSVFQWSSILNKMLAILSKTIENLNKMAAILTEFPQVQFWNGWDYCYDRPFQKPNQWKFGLQNVYASNVFDISMVIQVPTVRWCLKG